jgi:class 3 adenylate cyclase
MRDAQPSGTVTLVFTDVEGSTKLLEEPGTDAYRDALGDHRRVVREAFGAHRGYEVDYEGDALFYAFASAQEPGDVPMIPGELFAREWFAPYEQHEFAEVLREIAGEADAKPSLHG